MAAIVLAAAIVIPGSAVPQPTPTTIIPPHATPATTVPSAPIEGDRASPGAVSRVGDGWQTGDGADYWYHVVAEYFPTDRVDDALRVMDCESGGNPDAANPTSSAAGLFQFIRSTWDWVAGEIGADSYASGDVFSGPENVRAAAWLSDDGTDWAHWVCQP